MATEDIWARNVKWVNRADLHGTIFCHMRQRLTTGPRHDLRLLCTSEKCRSILKHFLKRCDNRKSCRRPVVSLSHATKIVPCKSALRNGPDKNDSSNGNEHVGIQLECKKLITFLLSVLTSDWLKQQTLTKLHKAVLYSSLLSNHLPYNKIWSQFEYHRNRMWRTCKIVNVSWLLFSTLVIGQNLLTRKTPFQNGL